MKKRITLKKRILSALLAAIVVSSTIPLTVFAADDNHASVTGNKAATEYAATEEADSDSEDSETAMYSGVSTLADTGVAYIDENGEEQICTDYIDIADYIADENQEGFKDGAWYVVKGDTVYGNEYELWGFMVKFDATANLILCDGASLTGARISIGMDSTLNIYGQSGNTGTLSLTSERYPAIIGDGVWGSTELNIYGGTINATATVENTDDAEDPDAAENKVIPAAIGLPADSDEDGTMTVGIYGGTVTAKADAGAQAIGRSQKADGSMSVGTITVNYASGMKCVKTDESTVKYNYDNVDGTSVTIEKCDHKWTYTNIQTDTHDSTCELCGMTESNVAHAPASYKYSEGARVHHVYCACGKDYAQEDHTYKYTTDKNVLTHTATCTVCGYSITGIEHTFGADSSCSSCGFTCLHADGNDREASYFQKAVCSVCKAEYGIYKKDTTAPTGEIIIKDKDHSWWKNFLNTISFGLFYKENLEAVITATDDSYGEAGFDSTKHAVKIEYFISETALSEEEVMASTFTEYEGTIALDKEQQYVIYVRVTDHAGNVSYASSDGLVIDKTAPTIEVISPVSETLTDENTSYKFCAKELVFNVVDNNIESVTAQYADTLTKNADGNYVLSYKEGNNEQNIVMKDKAGNESSISIILYEEHDFDPETGKCNNCGRYAAAKVLYGETTEWFVSCDDLFKAIGYDEKYNGATVTLMSDGAINSRSYSNMINDLTIDLNGKKLSRAAGKSISFGSCEVTICSLNGEGTIDVPIQIGGSGSNLTMGEGIGDVYGIYVLNGRFTVFSGNYGYLQSYLKVNEAENITLYGGSFIALELKTAACHDILAEGYRFKDVLYTAAAGTRQSDVTVIPCDHADFDENNICTGCNLKRVATVEKDGISTLFESFEEAIQYAEQNNGSTLKLWQDITIDKDNGLCDKSRMLWLKKGEYTLDLNGKTLIINDSVSLTIADECKLTIDDSVGGGKIDSDEGAVPGSISVVTYGLLTVMGGNFKVDVGVRYQDGFVLKGGSFTKLVSAETIGGSPVNPLSFLADGYAMTTGDRYANEGDAKYGGGYYITDVSVVKAPLAIVEGGQPTDKEVYLTSSADIKNVEITASYLGTDSDGTVYVTFEDTDGTVIEQKSYKTSELSKTTFSVKDFAISEKEYRIKLEYNGYILYSNVFRITVTECGHPGYVEATHKCVQCGCDLVAVIKNGDTVTGYTDFADALTAAQTEDNNGCTLKLFVDTSEEINVTEGTFLLDITGCTVGKCSVDNAELTIMGGTVSGTIDCTNKGSLNIETGCIVEGAINIDGGAEARLDNGDCRNSITVGDGGRLFIYSGSCWGTVTAESGAELTVRNGGARNIVAKSGSKLVISNGQHGTVTVEENADVALSSGYFEVISVAGKTLMDCLEKDDDHCYAFVSNADNSVIDGRANSAYDVHVIWNHVHEGVWDTTTHEKICACGVIEEIDTESPVFSGIEDGKTYYGKVNFRIPNEKYECYIVYGEEKIYLATESEYTLMPVNGPLTVVATDVAGNSTTITIQIMELYNVILPEGTGYTVTGNTTAGHGTDYEFEVKIADGYSRTQQYKVLCNGQELVRTSGDESSDKFSIENVLENMNITVEGVADITPPEAEITIGTNKFNSFMNTITFGLFFKKTQTVTVTASDMGSGIEKVEYLISETAFADKDAITGVWTALTFENGKAGFDIEPNRKAYVYIRVTDASGNVQVINSEGVVVYADMEKVSVSANFTMRDEADVTYELELNENAVSALYNGTELIDSSNYTVSADGILTLKNSYLRNLMAGEYMFYTTFDPLGVEYTERAGNDAPIAVTLKLNVIKATANVTLSADSQKRSYNGAALGEADFSVSSISDGNLTCEFKPANADDSAYTKTAPKNAGIYIIRASVSETDTFKAASETMEFEITPKEVTITGTAVEPNKIYDGTTDAVIANAGTLSDNFDGENLAIKAGKASFDNKNVGTDKNVSFSGFELTGSAAANYVLTVQPAGTTAGISAKELTISGLKVKDKYYDNSNTAEIDGTPALDGVVDGDVLELVNGTPVFDSVAIGNNIPVSFTEFTLMGDDVTLGNYTLKQPEGITANIVEYTADGSEYGVNSNDWINSDFVITAKEGYKLSLIGAVDGEWTDTLAASDETDNGKMTFYVKNTKSGVVSAAVTENYKIDRTAPTGEVKLNERTAFQTFLNKITFGLFFKDDVTVKITATDDASGVKSVQYYKSDKVLTDDEVRAITEWTENSDFNIKAKDMDKFIIYVRIEDNAGNVAYIGSDGVIFDTTAPAIDGVKNGNTYYVTKKVTVTDENLEEVTLNGYSVGTTFTLAGDTDAAYVIRAVDKAGNVTEYTVTMKPISSLIDDISAITVDNVKSSDMITAIGRRITEIIEAFDNSESTDDEWKKLTGAAAKCRELTGRMTEVGDEILRITDGMGSYSPDNVTGNNRKDIEKLITDINILLVGDNLTDIEREKLEELKGRAQACLKRILEIDTDDKDKTPAGGGDKVPADGKAETPVIKSDEVPVVRNSANDDVKPVEASGRAESPKTGDTGNLALLIALLFISGGVVTSVTVVNKKKKAL